MGELCGFEPTSTDVSRATAALDPILQAWRERPIEDAISHLIIDATYEKIRTGGQVISSALLVAIGIRKSDGKRTILGCSVSLSKAEIHWRTFLQTLKARSLGLPRMITSDAYQGLRAALGTRFSGVPWQRCQFHLQQNASAHVQKIEMKTEVASTLRRIFNVADRPEADARLAAAVETYSRVRPSYPPGWKKTFPKA